MSHIIANEDCEEIISKIRLIKIQQKYWADEYKKYTQYLYGHMGEHDEAVTQDGEVLASWKYSSDYKTFNLESFKENEPEAYEKYVVNREGVRRLVLK
jgi:hypothetical protein